jgi:dihydroflavonol-4-reductase
MSRYFVTGATGFLGAHLVRALAGEGHDVVALCRGDAGALAHASRVTVRRGDILDSASIRDAAAGCEGVFHCAGRVSRRPEDAGELHRLLVDGTKVTLEACRAAGVRRAVIASTSGVVAVTDAPDEVRNETAPVPFALVGRWPYYRSKLYAERAAFELARADFEVVSVNPSLLLGPGDVHGSSTGDVVKFLEGKVPFVPGGGLSFVDARDAATAMQLAMERGEPGARYLVGAANLTFEAFFGRLERISDVAAPKLRVPRSSVLARAGASLLERASRHLPIENVLDPVSADMAQYFWYVDSSLARSELGWSARDPNETLADTVEDLRARGVVWPAPR